MSIANPINAPAPSELGLVSAILPTYNSRKFVARSIDSVLGQQGGFTIELIIVDDCSTDDTMPYLERTYGDDPRVRLFCTDANGGPGHARNLALEQSRGDWIALIDADDAWKADRLLKMSAHCSQADFVADNLLGFDLYHQIETGPLLPTCEIQITLQSMAEKAIAGQFDLGFLKPLIRGEFVRRFRLAYPPLRCNEDLLLYLDILSHGAVTHYIPEGYYVYSTRVGQTSGVRSAMSQSKSDDQATARELFNLIARRADDLSAAEAGALERRAQDFRSNEALARFYDDWSTMDVKSMFAACISHPGLTTVLAQKAAKRVWRRLKRLSGRY